MPSDFSSIEVKRSYVETTYVTEEMIVVEEGVDAENKKIADCFDITIDTLNVLFLSYLVKMKDLNVYRISKEMVNRLSSCRVIYTNQWDRPQHIIFMLHFDTPYNPEPLDIEELGKIYGFLSAVRDRENPFVLQEELYLTAERYIKEGFYREACIFAQMMAEELLNTLYIELLIHEGKTETEAYKMREGLPFISMVRKGFHQRIGGQWNPDDLNTKCGTWYCQTYLMRNRVSHGGYFPSLQEARRAIEAAKDFRLYVVSLLHKKKKIYPNIARYFVP